MDELLHKFNINRETLNEVEKETLERWSKSLNQNVLGIADVREYITTMIGSLERELYGFDNQPASFASLFFRKSKRKHAEARLHNYVLLRDFLTAPERARSYVEKQLNNFKS
jgi:hypothetical protein